MTKNDDVPRNVRSEAAILFGFPGISGELKTELVRKSLHFLIALSPSFAEMNRPFTIAFLMGGILSYIWMESCRLQGLRVPLVTSITKIASRDRDRDRFVLGPVTLGLGSLLALVLFPPPAASVAIYAVAFGDGFASLVGKFAGSLRPSFLAGKSIEGSLACFAAVFVSAWKVSGDFHIAFIAAFIAMVVEALPLKDYDNIALPLTVGASVVVMMGGI